ncbi:hypothetical protein BJV74DRAFT_465691 [Russula compacta]|nr:hypothetical protein BJV74DRAFT_465691 [Russula compacta]
MASSSSNLQLIFNDALKEYQKKTNNDLHTHPLAAQLQACNSPTTILVVLHEQIQGLNQSPSTDDRLTRWLDPTINVLYAFSQTLGMGVSLAFSPAQVIFTGIGVFLLTARDVRASHDTFIDIFECFELFFRRLSIYTEVPPTAEMTYTVIKIMIEVLSILANATKEIKQGRIKKFLKGLTGRADIEDALKRLDKLTDEEAWMATAQVLKATNTIDGRMKCGNESVAGVDDRVVYVDNRVKAVDDKFAEIIHDGREAMQVIHQTASNVDQVKPESSRNLIRTEGGPLPILEGSQSREDLLEWLSPPDPSTNHNIASGAYHEGTGTWLFQGSIFNQWKSTPSLLWIHGKPGSGKSVLCSAIIQNIQAMCEAGEASMSYFYLDFRDTSKQHLHDLASSFLTQLSANSSPRCSILSRFYANHDNGARQPSDDALAKCLEKIVTLPDQGPIYLIIDALDECPTTSGIPSPRERVLQLLKELVDLRLPNVHICATSRPEVDICHVLEPLTTLRVSLHDQCGQKEDIVEYIRSIVYSDSEQIMKRWGTEDKELVIETLSKRADGS